MSISSCKACSAPLAFMAGALLLSGCEWALGPLPARTNPLDLKAPVAYFRATPQASMEETKLSWKWGDGSNPGEVYILRGQFSAPEGIDDSGAELVYRSRGDGTSFVDDFGDPVPASPDLTGQSYYYSMFYDDGDRVRALEPSRAVFEAHMVTLTQVQGLSFSYNSGTMAYGFNNFAAASQPMPSIEILGLVYIGFAGLPALNIDITTVNLSFSPAPTLAGEVQLNRITTALPDGLSYADYFTLIKNNYSTEGALTSVPTTTDPSTADITTIFQAWLDSLQPYGLRVEDITGEYVELQNPAVTVDYIGPAP